MAYIAEYIWIDGTQPTAKLHDIDCLFRYGAR